MVAPDAGCTWPLDEGCLGSDWAEYDLAVQTYAASLASATLRRLTGWRVGGCPVKVRPCSQARCGAPAIGAYAGVGYYGGSFYPQNWAGVWTNNGCSCLSDCSCTALDEVRLPEPVGEVFEVRLDGLVLNQGTDYVRYGNRLIATGTTKWPKCQDLTKLDTEVGTFSVTYQNSYAVDILGARAAGILAVEYAKACNGESCGLPTNAVSITRQGVSIELESGAFPGGLTGIRQVDAFIALWNPAGLERDSEVWSPDMTYPVH